MKRVLVILAALIVVLVSESQAAAPASCFCVAPRIDLALKKSTSIFVGHVIAISGPREIQIGDRAEQLYQVKLLVWERWKGATGVEVEVLAKQKEQPWCFEYPAMKVGETHLLFVDPIQAPDLPPNVDGIVNGCSNSIRLSGPAPGFESDTGGLPTMLELDRLTKPPTQRTPVFGVREWGKSLCLFCTIE